MTDLTFAEWMLIGILFACVWTLADLVSRPIGDFIKKKLKGVKGNVEEETQKGDTDR